MAKNLFESYQWVARGPVPNFFEDLNATPPISGFFGTMILEASLDNLGPKALEAGFLPVTLWSH